MIAKGDVLLLVSKDMGGANVGIPLAQEAIKAGYKIAVIAEGLAAGKYEDAGFRLYFKGTTDFSEESFSLDAMGVVERLKPAVVVTTLSVPINLEQSFGFAANNFRIPLVFLEDFWGVHLRSQAKPDLVLSIDQVGADLVYRKYGSLTRTKIVGNYTVNRIRELKIPEETREVVKRLRNMFDKVFVFAAGGAHVSEQIQLLKKCLRQTSDGVLIPRFHPKSVNLTAPSGKTFGEEWRELLKEFGDRVAYLESQATEPLVALADVTFSDFSTLLTTALVFKHQAVSIATPMVRQTMMNEVGFTTHPLVGVGLVKEVGEPRDLSEFVKEPDLLSIHEYLCPYDPREALRAIEAL